MKRDLLDRLMSIRYAKRPAALVTELASGRQTLVAGAEIHGDLPLDENLLAVAGQAIADDRSGLLAEGDGLFVQVFNPPLRLAVVGAVHIAQTLAPMAALAGYEVILIDPRRAWATEARFPEMEIATDWPDEALGRLDLDRRTAIVTLTHDPKLDDPALASALRSKVFYIGALGSRRTHAGRLDRLREEGFTDAVLQRIHGPVGLNLGAKSPAEIAISILAQITQVLHARSGTARAAAG